MARLRAPFVVTLSALGALSACSSSDADAAAADVGSQSDTAIATSPDDTMVVDTRDAAGDARDADATEASDAALDNPIGCPADDPGFGPFHQPCSIKDTIRCRYRDDCPQRPADAGVALNVYSCNDDGSGPHWTLVSPAYTPDCPVVEPVAGSACPCSPHMQYVACLYGTCEGLDSSYANCEGPEALEHAWRVTPSSCNPPEPDGGLDGDAHD